LGSAAGNRGDACEPVDRSGTEDAGFRDLAGNGWKMIQAARGST
jgi:hypothetical protein